MIDALSLLINAGMLIGICWLCVQAGLLERGEVVRDEDGEESARRVEEIVRATQPAELEPRPHVRAGTAWGETQ